MIEHRLDGPDLDLAQVHGALQVHQEHAQALSFIGQLVVRRSACQQQQQIGVLGARGPHLLAINDEAVPTANGSCLQAGRFGARVGLGHAKSLKAQLTAGDPTQIALFLVS